MAQLRNILTGFVALLFCVQQICAQISFSGYADADFGVILKNNATDIRFRTLSIAPSTFVVGVSNWMLANNLTSGWDVRQVFFQYDYQNDAVYVGVDCYVICGDADGDGNPSISTDRGASTNPLSSPDIHLQDTHLQINIESIALTLWTETPDDFETKQDYEDYFPDLVIGDSTKGDLTSFGSYTLDLFGQCASYGISGDDCVSFVQTMVEAPGDYFGLQYSPLSLAGFLGRPVRPVLLPRYPNATSPDIEFIIQDFSQYGNFNFTPGRAPCRFSFALGGGSSADGCGEESMYPFVVTFPCMVYDACGVCNGNNRSCWDCAHIPNGNHTYDVCGVCAGNGSSCWDCARVSNGNKTYDSCGVCGGNGSTCWDCAHVSNGGKVYDACGVCGGNGSSCWDCAHKSNGGKVYDQCGVCGGNSSSCWDCARVPNGGKVYDSCGVCGGNSSSCWDCRRVPNGGKVYDACGVCAGNGSSCWDCARVSNGGKVYDSCGVCGGNGTSCWDCAHQSNGGKVYDACGVCGGDGSSCWDCAHKSNGGKVYDACGVCAGDGSSCWDCAHKSNGGKVYDLCGVCAGNSSSCWDCARVPNGGKVYDQCGVCGGDSTSCVDCAGTPNGPMVYDLCGVCGGENNECACWIYENITILAQDTYIALETRNVNYGNDIDLVVSSDKERTLLRFDDIRFKVIGATEQRPTILSAKIRLFVRGVVKLPQQGWVDNAIVVHDLDHNFCEETATWECRDMDETGCCITWRMLALYPKVKADYAWEITANQTIVNRLENWLEFDVYDDILYFLENSFLNSKSYLIKKGCEKDFGWIRFWSCNSENQMNCPELVISIKAPCGPPELAPPIPVNPCEGEDK